MYQSKTVKVMTLMVGDLFHAGHLNLLERASKLGDYLIVGVPTSWTIKEHIKFKEPVFTTEDRLRIVQSIRYVDFAFAYTDNDSLAESIRLFRPDIFCRADDNTDFIGRDTVESIGAKIVFFPYTEGISATTIRSKLLCG
jgi:glycerol-3-phosphate cytidylyltransferase